MFHHSHNYQDAARIVNNQISYLFTFPSSNFKYRRVNSLPDFKEAKGRIDFIGNLKELKSQ